MSNAAAELALQFGGPLALFPSISLKQKTPKKFQFLCWRRWVLTRRILSFFHEYISLTLSFKILKKIHMIIWWFLEIGGPMRRIFCIVLRPALCSSGLDCHMIDRDRRSWMSYLAAYLHVFLVVLIVERRLLTYLIYKRGYVVLCWRIMKQMPSGRAFLCLDTKNLPSILQQIFTSTMLSTR